MIILFLIVSVPYLIAIPIWLLDVRRMTKREARIKSMQFSLFSLRDNIIRLAIDEKVSKESECFKFIYHLINRSISIIHEVKFEKSVIEAARKTDTQFRQKINKIVKKILEDNELKIVMVNYLDLLIDALWHNSSRLRVYLFLKMKIFKRGLGDVRRERLTKNKIIRGTAEPYLVRKDLEDCKQQLVMAA